MHSIGTWLGVNTSQFTCTYLTFAYFPPDSSVGIATRYGLDGPGIEFRCRRDFFAPVQAGPGVHPASCTKGTGSYPGLKRPGRGVDHPPPFSTKLKKECGYNLPLKAFVACRGVTFIFTCTPPSETGMNKTGKQWRPLRGTIHSFR